MPVILELEDYEASQVVDALVEQRIRLMKNWENRYRSPDENDGRYGIDIGKIGDLAMIDANIGTVYALRERLKDGIMVQRMCQEHALYPEKSVSVAWHHKRGWLPTADFVEKSIEDDQMSPGKWTTLPDEVDPDGWMFDITDPDDKIVIASADTQTDGTEVAFYTYDLTPAEKHKIKRELQGYDLITWNETIGGDYQGVDSSEHEASVIFVRKTKDDRYEVHPGGDINPMFRKHMKGIFSARCAYNSFEEVRNLVQDRAVAFFQVGGKSLSKRHLDIEISINGHTTTLRGTVGEAERLLKDLTAAHRRF